MNKKTISSITVAKRLLHLSALALLAFSASVAAAPPVPTLNTPYNSATNVSQSNVYFSWYSAGATSYRIVISQDASFSGFSDLNGSSTCNSTCFTTATSSTSYYKNMDLAGKTYYWKVRANNSTGASSFSSYRYFTTAGSASSPLSAKVDAFVNTWNGRGTDFDGAYGYQCVDLMRRYAQDVLGLSNGGYSELPAGNAYDIFAKTTSSKFTKIYNTPTGVPQKGDIVFWNKSSSNGYAGHVAIFISGSTSSFTSIDQNWVNPSSTKGSVAAKVNHSYSGVAGWLHPR
ncbi:MAG: CHAP domain-containing protein [Methylococcaceae bacterium]